MNKKRLNLLSGMLMLLLAVFCASFSSYAGDMPQDKFHQANRLYEEGKYQEALNLYREIEPTGSHWRLFYNMGNCLFKTEQWVTAKIYYLKARRLAPFNESIEKNISIVNKYLNDKISSPRPDFLTRLMLRVESIVSLNVMSVLLILTIFAFNVFVFLAIKRGKQRWIVYGLAFSLMITILTAGYHIHRVKKRTTRNVAVITSEKAQLYSGPGQNNTVLFKVNPGLEVKISDRNTSGDWLQVSASTEIAGWIQADRLIRI